jgi:hypothetical protein
VIDADTTLTLIGATNENACDSPSLAEYVIDINDGLIDTTFLVKIIGVGRAIVHQYYNRFKTCQVTAKYICSAKKDL